MMPLTLAEQHRVMSQAMFAAASLLPPGPARTELEREAEVFAQLSRDELRKTDRERMGVAMWPKDN
jgi:hypothetical protein